MRMIYIDPEYRCHVSDDGSMTAVETDFFDNKCDELVDGYRFVPEGKTWVNAQGIVFHGEMIAPWTDFAPLDISQRAYEMNLIKDMKNALDIMEVRV